MRDLDIDLIRCFLAVADTRSFTTASKRLCRSQSAVSTRVQKLKALLGIKLFERTSRSVSLTTAGEGFHRYAVGLLRLNDEAVGMMSRHALEGQLKLGLVEYLVPHRIPHLLARAARLMPKVELSVRIGLSDTLVRGFDAGELDVIVVREQEGRATSRLFREEPMLWIGSSPMDRPSEEVPMCLLPAPCAFRSAAVEALEREGISWRETVTVSGVLAAQACAREGLGVTVLSASAVPEGVAVLPQGRNAWPRLASLRLVTYERTPTPLTRALVEALQ